MLPSISEGGRPHRFGYKAADVAEILDRICRDVGTPNVIRVEQGLEFISHDLDRWANLNDRTLDFSRPCKPTDNAFIEWFNGKLRAECSNAHWFISFADARKKTGGLA